VNPGKGKTTMRKTSGAAKSENLKPENLPFPV